MNFLNNRAIKQLVDSMDIVAIVDMTATKVAILKADGKSDTYIVNAVTPVLKGCGYTTGEIAIFVQEHIADNPTKYDGYGPDGFVENTGYFHMTVECSKNQEEKVVRTVSVGFSTATGEPQDFGVPQKVTITEIS